MGLIAALSGAAGVLGGIQQAGAGKKLIDLGRSQQDQALGNSKVVNNLYHQTLGNQNLDAGKAYATASSQAESALRPSSYQLLQNSRLGVSASAMRVQQDPRFRSTGANLRDEAYRQQLGNAYMQKENSNFQTQQGANQNYGNLLATFGGARSTDGANQVTGGYNTIAETLARNPFRDKNLESLYHYSGELEGEKSPNPTVMANWQQDRNGGWIPPNNDWSKVPIDLANYLRYPDIYPKPEYWEGS